MRKTITATCAAAMLAAATPSFAAPDYPGASSYSQGIHYTARSSRSIRYVVIHTIEGTAAGALSWFKNPAAKVSAHYVVARDGTVTQVIREHDIAWHAGNWTYNEHSIGIEHEGYAGRDLWTDIQMRASAKLTAYLSAKYGILKDRSHIIGHIEVPGATHTDPGRYFDWSYYMSLVRGSSAPRPGPTPPPPPRPTPGPSPAPSGVRSHEVTTASLNYRTGAWGTILGSMSRGSLIASDSTSGAWSRGYRTGRAAYFYTSYTRTTGHGVCSVTVDTANVRSAQSLSASSKVGTASRGQKYVIHFPSGDWYLIQYDHRRDWIHRTVVAKVK